MARICFMRQFYYPQDLRTRGQVEAMLSAGHEVDVICVRRPGQPMRERRDSLTVWRVPLMHRRAGKLLYVLQYGLFFLLAALLVTVLHMVRRFHLVSVHSLPDALVFAALVPRLTGARVKLDLHETMPEFFATKYGVDMDHPMVRMLVWLEQASIRFAHYTITCNEQMRQRFIERGAAPERIGVVMNSADESVFSVQKYPPRKGASNRFTLVSHGSVEERYGLDIGIKAVALLKDELPDLRLAIYGEGTFESELRELARVLNVADRIEFHGFVPLDELLTAIASADAGLVAMKRDIFRDLTHCLKMFEFISMRKPVISSRTRAVEEIFDERSLLYFEAGSEQDLARAIRRLRAEPQLGEELVARASAANVAYSWPRQREHFLSQMRPLLPA